MPPFWKGEFRIISGTSGSMDAGATGVFTSGMLGLLSEKRVRNSWDPHGGLTYGRLKGFDRATFMIFLETLSNVVSLPSESLGERNRLQTLGSRAGLNIYLSMYRIVF